MDTQLFSDLATAAPSWPVQALLTLVQLFLWQLIWSYSERLLPAVLERFAFFRELSPLSWRILPVPLGTTPPAGAIRETSERGGFDTRYGFCIWCFISMHHTIAGGLVLYSRIVDDGGAAFRHGCLVSLGGIDLLQILQMAAGASPFDEPTPPIPPVQDVRLILAAHHAFGLLVVLPANLWLSTDVDAQLVAIAALIPSAVSTRLPRTTSTMRTNLPS